MSYARQIAAAKRLIASKGAPAKLVGIAKAFSPDPQKPWETTSAPRYEQDVSAVFLPASYSRRELTPEGAQQVLVAADGLEDPPSLKGELRVGDPEVVWRIERVEVLAPDGVPILYTLTVAR